MPDRRQRLQEVYGDALPPSLAALSDAEVEHLVGAIDDAQARQRSALAAATDTGMAVIPRVLRGPVRRVLFG